MATNTNRNQYKTFQIIDDALATYYYRHGINDYYDSNGRGLFLNFIITEDLNDPGLPIERELGDACAPFDCAYSWMYINESTFPIPSYAVIPQSHTDAFIFYVLQHCYKYHVAPTEAYIKDPIIPKCNGTITTYSSYVGEKEDAKLWREIDEKNHDDASYQSLALKLYTDFDKLQHESDIFFSLFIRSLNRETPFHQHDVHHSKNLNPNQMLQSVESILSALEKNGSVDFYAETPFTFRGRAFGSSHDCDFLLNIFSDPQHISKSIVEIRRVSGDVFEYKKIEDYILKHLIQNGAIIQNEDDCAYSRSIAPFFSQFAPQIQPLSPLNFHSTVRGNNREKSYDSWIFKKRRRKCRERNNFKQEKKMSKNTLYRAKRHCYHRW